MGLDQLAFSREQGKTICSWRKHPNLQGWMERLYEQRGGTDTFNCVELRLDEEDIKQLREDVKNGTLNGGEDDTEGFFFGSNSDEYYKEQDLEFCQWALEALNEGKDVIYDSWW